MAGMQQGEGQWGLDMRHGLRWVHGPMCMRLMMQAAMLPGTDVWTLGEVERVRQAPGRVFDVSRLWCGQRTCTGLFGP